VVEVVQASPHLVVQEEEVVEVQVHRMNLQTTMQQEEEILLNGVEIL
jgi:hypothetical protein